MARTDSRPRLRLDPDARREAILRSAAAAFAERPYAEVTLADIAEGARASTPLVYRYFHGKEDLYAQVVRESVDALMERQARAIDELPDGVPVRDRIRMATIVYLDHIATHPDAWAMPMRRPGGEPAAVAELRTRTRRDYVKRLQDLLAPSTQARHGYALWGYFGFIDAAALRWVDKGCPEEDRWALVDAALGALEGALGDWAA